MDNVQWIIRKIIHCTLSIVHYPLSIVHYPLKMSLFKHGIASVSLPGTLLEKLKAIAKAGYDGIELFENDLTVSNLKPTDVHKIATDLGIEIAALQPFRDYEAMPKQLYINSLDRAKYKFDLMHKLGTNRLFVCSNCSPFALDDADLAAEQLSVLAGMAEKEGISVSYEALSWGRFVNTYHQSVDIVERANHPNLGNLLDSYHIGVMRENLDKIRTIPVEKLNFVQVADSQHYDMSAIYIGRHLRCFPGQGTFPVIEYTNAVISTGYSGYISHEIFSDEFRSSQLDPIALDGKRSLVWLEGVTDFGSRISDFGNEPPVLGIGKKKAKSSKAQISATNPTSDIPNPTSNTPSVSDIEFIEFSTDFINQQNLVALLTALGFKETYTHKTKDVSLYQVGDVNIVLNRQRFKVVDKMETTVCAIGFVAQEPERFRTWAQKLNYAWIESTAKTDELNISAVKGVGDILCYIVDENDLKQDFYEVEFNLTGKIKAQNGITKIDHIGHTVGADYFQANTLFYRAMLGLEIEDSLELYDPNGIVSSRVVRTADKNIRISLSSTRSRKTSSDYFMTKVGEAGIQQIALATDDIFKTANSIVKKDYILPMPSNYYEDLRAKGALPLPTIQKMQDLDILFDTNTEGSFFHFYCKELNGLFIEIVQRIGNYDRYGEINAQLRLAAQARDRR
jgi:4-hydroxyphenylpyruvate dioxygenase